MTVGALSLTGCNTAARTEGASAPDPKPTPAALSSSAAAALAPGAGTATPGPAEAIVGAEAPAADVPVAAVTPGQTGAGSTAGDPAAAAPAAPVAAAPSVPAAPVPAAPPAVTPVNPVPPAPATGGRQAASTFGWGPVLAGDEFSNTGGPDSTKWSVFKGEGHDGKGVRSPAAWSVANGVATVRGDARGTTGGMSAKFAQQKYGRWETRMKTSARDPQYHPVLILWPNDNKSGNCAEIDYAEGSKDTGLMKFFLHYSCGGRHFQTTQAHPVDSTQWHNYAVEWTPAGITGYIDGKRTFTDTDPAHQPTVGMHQTLQLDWFPDGSATKPSEMQVDWVRVYNYK